MTAPASGGPPWLRCLLGVVIAGVLTLAVVAARFDIAQFFLGNTAENALATIDLAATLLLVGASFIMTDAMQSIAIGSLRGSKGTRLQLVFAAIGYWLTGLCLLDRIGGRHRNLCSLRC